MPVAASVDLGKRFRCRSFAPVTAGDWNLEGAKWRAKKRTVLGPPLRYAKTNKNGTFGTLGGDLADTWVWNGSEWSQKFSIVSPAGRSHSAMVFDSALGEVVLFGGSGGTGALNDTWIWDGNTWSQRFPANSPPARFYHAMAYDGARKQVVLFGGNANSGNFSDTWTWDGSNWTQRTPSTNPAYRGAQSMAYDAKRQEIVMFGGWPFDTNIWIWNGSTWTTRSSDKQPLNRSYAGMCYSVKDEKVILFGGYNMGGLAETWTWDGSTWSQASPVQSPPVREVAGGMVCDIQRQEVMLFGGCNDSSAYYMDDTWILSTAKKVRGQITSPGIE